jgi:hypothetical protein
MLTYGFQRKHNHAPPTYKTVKIDLNALHSARFTVLHHQSQVRSIYDTPRGVGGLALYR